MTEPTARARLLEVAGWRAWLGALFPRYVVAGFAPHHEQIWDWIWALRSGMVPAALVVVLPRGGAKSTTAELGCVAVAAKETRRYGWYISGTQYQADDHVQNVAGMLETEQLGTAYPLLGRRMLSKYGSSKGWRRNRLRTASGFTLDAIGLDTASRGKKIDADRPDFFVVDDIDEKHDSPLQTTKKIETLTTTLLPAGSTDLAVLAVQNLIVPDGLFAQVVDGRADFLTHKIVLGPYKAVDDLTYEIRDGRYLITGGAPTWAGQNLATCEEQMNTWGLHAFLSEAQHEVRQDPAAGIFKREHIRAARVSPDDVPPLARVVVGVDPSGSAGGDEAGIVVVGVDTRYPAHAYVLGDYTLQGTPDAWADAAISAYHRHEADRLVAEVNYGGDMVESTLRLVPRGRSVSYKAVRATRGKAVRAEPCAALYEQGRVHHAGHFPKLEDQQCQWVPGMTTSPGRLDGLVWALTDLLLPDEPEPPPAIASMAAGGGWSGTLSRHTVRRR